MSEYWKSTPKYWCKNCSVYVRDTPFERRQHETTAKHQNNLKRFLRDIQNGHERNERDKQRAKAEVERLNKITGDGSTTAAGPVAAPSAPSSAPTFRKSTSRPLTAADQKRQWSQLSEMGVQVPDSYRAEMAMSGKWEPVAKPTPDAEPEEESLSKGIHKRKLDQEEEEEREHRPTERKAWGRSTKSYPGRDTSDLDSLLIGSLPLKKEPNVAKDEGPRVSPLAGESSTAGQLQTSRVDDGNPDNGDTGRVDVVSEGAKFVAEDATAQTGSLVKTEFADGDGETAIKQAPFAPVFKKRKGKASLPAA